MAGVSAQRAAPRQDSTNSHSTDEEHHGTFNTPPLTPSPPFYVKALYPFSGENTSAMSFRQGELIEVLNMLQSGWWDGVILDGRVRGWFPSNYVTVISEEEFNQAKRNSKGWWSPEDNPNERNQNSRQDHDEFQTPRATRNPVNAPVSLEELAEDLPGFSSGGNIFAEIAAAAAKSDLERRRPSNRESQSYTQARINEMERRGSLSTDTVPEEDEEEDFWVPKVTNTGQLFYYNTRTGETSRDMPTNGQGESLVVPEDDVGPELLSPAMMARKASLAPNVYTSGASEPAAINKHSRESTGGTSLLSTWTDRTYVADKSDQQSLDTLVMESDPIIDPTSLEARRQQSRFLAAEAGLEKEHQELKPAGARKKQARKLATAELLEAPPPPLLKVLGALVSTALQNLIVGVDLGGSHQQSIVEPQIERDGLAILSDAVVTATRNLLHASGALEPTAFSSRNRSSISTQAPFSRPLKTSLLPAEVQNDLRLFTRRLLTSLSKLSLSTRAVWGTLETIPSDQQLDSDLPTDDPEEIAKRQKQKADTLERWAKARERRKEHDVKLRSDVLAGARDVQLCVGVFLAEFGRALTNMNTEPNGTQPSYDKLRAPKALQASLRTNAAALLLPGGGYGGNWRGNGFVTLPSPQSSPALPTSGAQYSLDYSYPSRSLSAEIASSIEQDAITLLQEACAIKNLIESLCTGDHFVSPDFSGLPSENTAALLALVTSLGTPNAAIPIPMDLPPPTSQGNLMRAATQLQRLIASFLTSVEEIDVATSVDFDLSSDTFSSRPGSRANDISESYSNKESDADSVLDPPFSAGYGSSVQEARPLLAELEIGKQGLYDIAPSFLIVIQELFMSPPTRDFVQPSNGYGPQPSASSPLDNLAMPTRSTNGLNTLVDVLSDLGVVVKRLCDTLNSLGLIADAQGATSPHNKAMSLVLPNLDRESVSPPSALDSGLASVGATGSAISPSSSGVSLQQRESKVDDDAMTGMSTHSRDSTESEGFFFSKGRDSIASNIRNAFSSSTSVADSKSDSFSPRLGSTDDFPISASGSLTSPTRKKKLQQLLGADVDAAIKHTIEEPKYMDEDYGPDEITWANLDSKDQLQVRGGTLKALVVAATSHRSRIDNTYLSAFLMTYQTFCDSQRLLELLIERYLIEPPEELTTSEAKDWRMRKQIVIRARVANVIKSWVRDHMDDIINNKQREVLASIRNFAMTTMKEQNDRYSQQLERAVQERLTGISLLQITKPASNPPPSINVRGRKFKFTDIDPLELARQLTLKDAELFNKITQQECLGKAWPKQFGSETPNISAMIDMSNAVTRWVTDTILCQEDQKKRAVVIKHFVLVAERCMALNNFSTVIHIMAGLNSTPIHRLRRTWEVVNAKALTVYGTLSKVMRPDKNYKIYRETLRNATPPCVPFLGVYLTDWTFIGDGNPDMLREKPHQINFNKRQKASELILQIKLHQDTAYTLAKVPAISNWLDEQFAKGRSEDPSGDDQRLYELSLMLEPRERDDEKIARLLSESGFL